MRQKARLWLKISGNFTVVQAARSMDSGSLTGKTGKLQKEIFSHIKYR